MGAVSALSTSIDALKRNPVLFAGAFVISLTGGVVLGAQALQPGPLGHPGGFTRLSGLLTALVYLAMPFFFGGLCAMANEGIRGRTTLGTLLLGGRRYYLKLFIATILFFALTYLVALVIGVVGFGVVLAAVFVVDPTSVPLPTVIGLGVVVTSLLVAVPLFFLQFYVPAVVVSDSDVIESLKRSYRVVRSNLLATLGFDAVYLVVMTVGSLPTIALYARWFATTDFAAGEPAAANFSPFVGLDGEILVVYFASTLVLGTFVGAFFWTYLVAFYREVGLESEDGEDATDDPEVSFQA